MLKPERHHRINELLKERGSVLVNDLSAVLDASKETIRRDLAQLEKKGFLQRTHGGALPAGNQIRNVTVPLEKKYEKSGDAFRVRATQNTETKIRLAKKALSFIKPGQVIMLDCSSSAWFLSRQLPDIAITVLTDSLNVIHTLASKPNIRIIGLGGEYSEKTESFSGALTEQIIKDFRINHLFFSSHGISLDGGVRDINENQARLKQSMIAAADNVILLCDSRKVERSSFCKICDFGDIDTLIIDQLPGDDYRTEISWNNVKIIELGNK